MSTQLRDSWISFAHGGDPGWPEYDTRQRLTKVFDVAPNVTTYPEERSRRLWQHHVFGALGIVDSVAQG